MNKPLEGYLVISIEQAIAAPYCTRLLADLGARVVKVERPGGGDFARAYDQRARGLSSHFVWVNRSKESLALDLKNPRDIECLERLVSRADIFVQNLAPGAAKRLGFGHQQLREKYPGLVTCSISGYGEGGPYEERKAYDLLIQAEAGFLSITGTPDQPAKAGLSIADIAAGVTAYNTILAILLNRQKTGKGDHAEISMLEAMAEWMGYPLYYTMDGAEPPQRAGAGHATIFPYGPYDTADGQVFFGLQNDNEWSAFCRIVIRIDEMATDERFRGNTGRAAHRDEINKEINQVLSQLTTSNAMDRLAEANIGTASVNDMARVWDHPQLTARQRWQEIETPVGILPTLLPISGNGWKPKLGPVPDVGQHNAAILRELGMNDEVSHNPDENTKGPT